jgi:Zn-dependent M28 family amino/carboxypeptidase
VAAVLELAYRLRSDAATENLCFVFFANEEPPYFQSDAMGSFVYARRCSEMHERVKAMLALETIGYYSDLAGSQSYPLGFDPGYPDRGDFLGFVSDLRSAELLRRVLKVFRDNASLPSEGGAAPALVPGVGWSDHWAFWQFGYPAIMITDTAPYRYPYYHSAEDTPDKLDYDRMGRAIVGLEAVLRELAGE